MMAVRIMAVTETLTMIMMMMSIMMAVMETLIMMIMR